MKIALLLTSLLGGFTPNNNLFVYGFVPIKPPTYNLPHYNIFRKITYPKKNYPKITDIRVPGNKTIVKEGYRNTKLYAKNRDDDDNDKYKYKDKDPIERLGWKKNDIDNNDDLLAKYAEWFGFPSDQKWRAIRYTFYAMLGGYLLGEAGDKLTYLFHLKDNPFWDS